MDKFEIITLSIYSILAFFVGKEFFLPQLNKLYKWLKNEKNETEDRTFQVGEEVHKLKMNEVEYYEETFNTLLGVIVPSSSTSCIKFVCCAKCLIVS